MVSGTYGVGLKWKTEELHFFTTSSETPASFLTAGGCCLAQKALYTQLDNTIDGELHVACNISKANTSLTLKYALIL